MAAPARSRIQSATSDPFTEEATTTIPFQESESHIGVDTYTPGGILGKCNPNEGVHDE